jgi:hypothetical protein
MQPQPGSRRITFVAAAQFAIEDEDLLAVRMVVFAGAGVKLSFDQRQPVTRVR